MYTKDGMNMYTGTYRVVCEFCRETLKPCKEDNYIYCANGGQIYRYSDDVLVYYRNGISIPALIRKFKENGIEILNDGSTPHEALIQFYEKDIDVVAKLVKARTTGVNIKSVSTKNLRLFKWFNDNKEFYIKKGLYKVPKELTEEEKDIKRKQLMKNLSRESA
ncbi:conserved hypothetical protein [Clostridium neonatale]|uniref:hypothetical protein n=1 Tax=Clostridium neonatale TaxID=137838 RepID=UPI00291C0760|nr:hypothetical protein [Clostridium neonatale]CAI3544520.1 conserved hypothetical protein [Clostridium neonatale]